MSMSENEKSAANGKEQLAETTKSIITRHETPLGWLIINRPQVKNALNYEAWRGIVAAIDELNADPDVRVIVMRGVTADSFISGADISEFPSHRANAEQARAYRERAGVEPDSGAIADHDGPTLAIAARVGKTRLIDNVLIREGETP